MLSYYSRRAPELEKVYEKPERQTDLAELRRLIPTLFAEHHVLEIACGTGYWTRRIAPVASSLLATDASDAMLAEARRNCAGSPRLTFRKADAFALPADLGSFDALFCGFLWSHVRRAALPGFLASLAAALPGARFLFVDNRYVPGSSTPLSRTEGGDAFQRRTLADGSTHEVVKNFPPPAEVQAVLAPHAAEVRLTELSYYWLAWGRFGGFSG